MNCQQIGKSWRKNRSENIPKSFKGWLLFLNHSVQQSLPFSTTQPQSQLPAMAVKAGIVFYMSVCVSTNQKVVLQICHVVCTTIYVVVSISAVARQHCNAVLYRAPATTLNKLQRVQNLARVVYRFSGWVNARPLLKSLHWLLVMSILPTKLLYWHKIFTQLQHHHTSQSSYNLWHLRVCCGLWTVFGYKFSVLVLSSAGGPSLRHRQSGTLYQISWDKAVHCRFLKKIT